MNHPTPLRYTTVMSHRNIVNERLLVAALIPQLSWRRHGIGCLQAYVCEASDPELRVHIWHPKIRREGIRDRGDIHDHRFTMHSTILSGRLTHIEYHVDVASAQDEPVHETAKLYDVYQVIHARADIGARYEQVPGPLGAKHKRVFATGHEVWLHEGESYIFNRGAFHCTHANGLAVTLVQKHDQTDAKAQILALHGTEPVHAFEADDDFDMAPFVAAAVKALR